MTIWLVVRKSFLIFHRGFWAQLEKDLHPIRVHHPNPRRKNGSLFTNNLPLELNITLKMCWFKAGYSPWSNRIVIHNSSPLPTVTVWSEWKLVDESQHQIVWLLKSGLTILFCLSSCQTQPTLEKNCDLPDSDQIWWKPIFWIRGGWWWEGPGSSARANKRDRFIRFPGSHVGTL